MFLTSKFTSLCEKSQNVRPIFQRFVQKPREWIFTKPGFWFRSVRSWCVRILSHL